MKYYTSMETFCFPNESSDGRCRYQIFDISDTRDQPLENCFRTIREFQKYEKLDLHYLTLQRATKNSLSLYPLSYQDSWDCWRVLSNLGARNIFVTT